MIAYNVFFEVAHRMESLSGIPEECIVSTIHLLASDIRHRLMADLAHRVSC